MKKILLGFLLLTASFANAEDLYDLSYKSITAKKVKMSDYKGKVVLIVNTASMCGYTDQFGPLEKLYQKYKSKGFTVIGFPSKSFKQEYSSDKKAANFCKMKYGVTFPLASISAVTGKDKNEVFKYLVQNSPTDKNKDVSWNFNKFLIDQKGNVVARYGSRDLPLADKIEKKIKSLLSL